MPRDTATRRFQLTFNNPKEHDYSHEKIKSLLEAGGKIGYWCMGDEIGTQETYHTHLYVEFVNPTMIKTVQKRFYGAHIEYNINMERNKNEMVSQRRPLYAGKDVRIIGCR